MDATKPMKFDDKLRKALMEELAATAGPAAGDPGMDDLGGKGVADTKEQTVKVSTKTTTEEPKLDGKNDCVGKSIPVNPPKDGKVAEGDPSMGSPTGKGLVKQTVGCVTSTATPAPAGAVQGKPEMDKKGGEGVAGKTVKQSKDLPAKGNAMESIILPHDVVVEQDGKTKVLKKGTRVSVLKEEEDKPDFLKGKKDTDEVEDDGADEGAADEGGEAEGAEDEGGDEGGDVGAEDIGADAGKDEDAGAGEEIDIGGGEFGADAGAADAGAGDMGAMDEIVPGDFDGMGADVPGIDAGVAPEGAAIDKIVAGMEVAVQGFRELGEKEKEEEIPPLEVPPVDEVPPAIEAPPVETPPAPVVPPAPEDNLPPQ